MRNTGNSFGRGVSIVDVIKGSSVCSTGVSPIKEHRPKEVIRNTDTLSTYNNVHRHQIRKSNDV